jgi:ABC-type proline/glycine betaine transport system ATPase subunit
MTPISARSYQEKKMTINQQLERTLTQMKTPTASQLAGGMAAGVGIARL